MRLAQAKKLNLNTWRRLVLPLCAVAGLWGSAAQAGLTTIDFSDQTASFVAPVANPLVYPAASFSSDNGMRIFTFTGGVSLDKGLCPHLTRACESALIVDLSGPITGLTFDVFQVDELDRILNVKLTTSGGTETRLINLSRGWATNSIMLTGLTGVTRLVLDGTSDIEGVIYDNFALQSADDLPPGGGVPEPASWALLIAGFALTGAALRARKPLNT